MGEKRGNAGKLMETIKKIISEQQTSNVRKQNLFVSSTSVNKYVVQSLWKLKISTRFSFCTEMNFAFDLNQFSNVHELQLLFADSSLNKKN